MLIKEPYGDDLIYFFDYDLVVDEIDYSSHSTGWQQTAMFELKDDHCWRIDHLSCVDNRSCGFRYPKLTEEEIDHWVKYGWPVL